jgi:hypothetical protein
MKLIIQQTQKQKNKVENETNLSIPSPGPSLPVEVTIIDCFGDMFGPDIL